MTDARGDLTVERPRAKWRDRLRRYSILVDGEEVARLKHGESFTRSLREGAHTLQARIDWSGSDVVDIVVERGQELRCLVAPAGERPDLTRALSTNGYLTISVADSAS